MTQRVNQKVTRYGGLFAGFRAQFSKMILVVILNVHVQLGLIFRSCREVTRCGGLLVRRRSLNMIQWVIQKVTRCGGLFAVILRICLRMIFEVIQKVHVRPNMIHVVMRKGDTLWWPSVHKFCALSEDDLSGPSERTRMS